VTDCQASIYAGSDRGDPVAYMDCIAHPRWSVDVGNQTLAWVNATFKAHTLDAAGEGHTFIGSYPADRWCRFELANGQTCQGKPEDHEPVGTAVFDPGPVPTFTLPPGIAEP
jgi:hypothetical protein